MLEVPVAFIAVPTADRQENYCDNTMAAAGRIRLFYSLS